MASVVARPWTRDDEIILSVFKKNLASGSPLAVRPLTDACTLN